MKPKGGITCDCARDDFFISMRLVGELELAAAYATSLSRRILSIFLPPLSSGFICLGLAQGRPELPLLRVSFLEYEK